jgi:hypothetical protein
VKVARKCSIANILGNAVEYTWVLKKREYRLSRLRAEQAGLKFTFGGLALVGKWEWEMKYGGEEQDEVHRCLVDLLVTLAYFILFT